MKEIIEKLNVLLETSPSSFGIEKSYNYFCKERNEVLNSYRIILKYKDNMYVLITLMVGNEIYTDEVICNIYKEKECIYKSNLSIEELVERIKNKDFNL